MRSIEAAIVPFGIVLVSGSSWTPYVAVTDHLGSTRAMVNLSSGTVAERNDYYAFGTRITAPTSSSSYPQLSSNRWRYSGKEEQEDVSGLKRLDYGARHYDPFLGSWISPDPLADKYYGWSPYAFCADDPVNIVDLNGMDIYMFDNEGNFVNRIEKKGTHIIQFNTFDINNNPVIKYYSFADPDNDPKAIDKGDITKLMFVSEQTILDMLTNQGTFDPSISPIDFIKASNSLSINDYSFDFTSSELVNRYPVYLSDHEVKSNYLFISPEDNMAHNLMNYGNYLWGASGYTFGFPLFILKTGANINSLGLFGHRTNRLYNGYYPQFDSKDDQNSIKAGFEHAKRNKYRNYRKK